MLAKVALIRTEKDKAIAEAKEAKDRLLATLTQSHFAHYCGRRYKTGAWKQGKDQITDLQGKLKELKVYWRE